MAQNEQQKAAAKKAEEEAAAKKAEEEAAAKKAEEEAAAKKAEEEAAAKKAAAEKPDWVVAEGKSITSKKGVLAPGNEVKEEYLGGGKKSFDALKKQKIVVKG